MPLPLDYLGEDQNQERLRNAAIQALDQAATALHPDGRTLRGAALGRRTLFTKLARTLATGKEEPHEQEPAGEGD